jgi:predicted NUDIX family NTP pyrophosphohydrolase
MGRRRSAGILPFRWVAASVEVLVGHMGGPLWARRDVGGWTVIKGEPAPDESPLSAAQREFAEELGFSAPDGELISLGEVKQAGGKVVTVWAVEGEVDQGRFAPGMFTMEWPRGSGTMREFPEIDRVEWLPVDVAREKLVTAQREFLDRLLTSLGRS